jgi:hypothetical protein
MVCPMDEAHGLRAEGLGNDAVRPVRAAKKRVWGHHRLRHTRDINQMVERDGDVSRDRLQHWRGGAAA